MVEIIQSVSDIKSMTVGGCILFVLVSFHTSFNSRKGSWPPANPLLYSSMAELGVREISTLEIGLYKVTTQYVGPVRDFQYSLSREKDGHSFHVL